MLEDSNIIVRRYPKVTELNESLENMDEIGLSLLKKYVRGKTTRSQFYTTGMYVSYTEKNFSLSSAYRGGPKSKIRIWQSIKNEFFNLFCTEDPRYASARKRIDKANGATAVTVAGVVTAIISKSICVAFGAISGAVTFLVWALFSVGKNAYCELYR